MVQACYEETDRPLFLQGGALLEAKLIILEVISGLV